MCISVLYLIVTLLCKKATFPYDQIQSNTRHQHSVTHIPKHNSKQEGKGDDGVRSCNVIETENQGFTSPFSGERDKNTASGEFSC